MGRKLQATLQFKIMRGGIGGKRWCGSDMPTEIVSIIHSLGVPVSILAAMGYAIFKTANFLGPKITDLTEAHLKLVDTLDKQLLIQTNLISSQSKLLQEQTEILKDIHRSVGKGTVQQ